MISGADPADPIDVSAPDLPIAQQRHHDPDAARAVYSEVGVTMVGVDVAIGIRFTGNGLDRLATATSPAGMLLWRALPYCIAFHEAEFGPAPAAPTTPSPRRCSPIRGSSPAGRTVRLPL